jgi:hypothetical protein
MKRIELVFLVLACLLGCKENDSQSPFSDNEPAVTGRLGEDRSDLPKFNFNFDQTTPGGIQIETRGHAVPVLADIDTWYVEAQQCVEDWWTVNNSGQHFETIVPPPVVIDDDMENLCLQGATGVYCTNFEIPFAGLQTAWAQYEFQWKHEFMHHVLYWNDYDNDANLNHQPAELWDCQFQ